MLFIIGDEGAGDLQVVYMRQGVGIAQLPGEEHDVAGILALFIDPFNIFKLTVNIFLKQAAKILILDRSVDDVHGDLRTDNADGNHRTLLSV